MFHPNPPPHTEGNENGEIMGLGPEWKCGSYGQPGHDYHYCRDCQRRFDGHMAIKRGRAAIMGGAA
jgi:hypothetical protein